MKMPNQIIREEIVKKGVISFARFMELALYCPETGYYETESGKVGRGGDFITSVSTGNLFGQLLAFQFAEWLQQLKIQNEKLKIIEVGAHDGKLANDILTWLQTQRLDLFSEIEYVIIEPSARRQSWQRETLKQFSSVRWFTDFENLKLKIRNSKLSGIFFSNELLDAFPVHRFGWDAKNKNWFEWGVTVENEKLAWAKLENPSSVIRHWELPAALLEVLPDNYTIETSPAAENWWREAAGILAHGKLLAIDYGFGADEMFSPSRTRGTLRAYYKHRITDDLLANPGEQDLTAHVNFSAIQKVGEAAGLATESFSSQAKFLTQILARTQTDKSFGEWNQSRTRQFQTLTHPEHFGRAFRVLVQAR